jgi:hypothetical protein
MPNRRERRSRPVSIAPVIALAILAVGIAFAQQNLPVPPPPPPKATPAAGDTPAPAGGEAAGADAGGAAAESAPAKPVAAKGSPQRFEPTEKVRPDFDVAFPVDI